jgi:hypothetical protein
MKGLRIGDEEFKDGKWLGKASQLLSFPRTKRHNTNGSHQAADLIKDLLK